MKINNWKTSALGIICILLTAITLLLVFAGKATLDEAGRYLTPLLGLIIGLNAFLTADHDKV